MAAVLGDEPLTLVDTVAGVHRHRAGIHRRDILVLHARPPDTSVLVDEAEMLVRLDGAAPAPRLLASGRGDAGDEWLVVGLTAAAEPASSGHHGLDTSAVVGQLAGALRHVHRTDTTAVEATRHLDRSPARLHARAAAKVAAGEVTRAVDGPFAGRLPEELLAATEAVVRRSSRGGEQVVVHGSPTLSELWLAPEAPPVLTGWAAGGLGDRHLDLAVAALDVAQVFGPALVGPFLEAYGTDAIDTTRLDAFQMLVHLDGGGR
ncbi:MAG: hypothetical protein D6683_09990 [Actinomyces sp.]|nr:MAG: hypothetical protein D6683_09990 [Actinomyces sp.]